MTQFPPAGLRIRKADLYDSARLAELHTRAATEGYRRIFPPGQPLTAESLVDGWEDLLVRADVEVVVAELNDLCLGSVVLETDKAGRAAWLKRLHVDPGHWGRGVGSCLHNEVLQLASHRGHKQLNLWVLEKNTRARRMYERRGWQLVPGRTLSNDPYDVIDVLYQRRTPNVPST